VSGSKLAGAARLRRISLDLLAAGPLMLTACACGGQNLGTSSTLYYKTGPYSPSGSLDSDGSYTVSLRTGDLPTAATVGASGLLSTDSGITLDFR